MKTAGIVTKTTKYGDTSLIITAITRDFGKISAIANGVRTKNSRMRAGTALFAYSEMVLYRGKSKDGMYNVNEITAAESFSGISLSLEKLAYASYFAELANYASAEENTDEELLRLLLNTLFAVDRDLCSLEKIKTVFEWRLACVAGYAPRLDACGGCGTSEGLKFISTDGAAVLCEECAVADHTAAGLSDGMRKTVEYICTAESKKIFSFDAGEETVRYLSRISEIYIRNRFEHEFASLEFLKKVQ